MVQNLKKYSCFEFFKRKRKRHFSIFPFCMLNFLFSKTKQQQTTKTSFFCGQNKSNNKRKWNGGSGIAIKRGICGYVRRHTASHWRVEWCNSRPRDVVLVPVMQPFGSAAFVKFIYLFILVVSTVRAPSRPLPPPPPSSLLLLLFLHPLCSWGESLTASLRVPLGRNPQCVNR